MRSTKRVNGCERLEPRAQEQTKQGDQHAIPIVSERNPNSKHNQSHLRNDCLMCRGVLKLFRDTVMNESRQLSGSSPLVVEQKRVKSANSDNSNRMRKVFSHRSEATSPMRC